MPNDAYEHMKMLLNVNKNAKIVIECELRANVLLLALMNASSRYWSSIHANEWYFLVMNSKRGIRDHCVDLAVFDGRHCYQSP